MEATAIHVLLLVAMLVVAPVLWSAAVLGQSPRHWSEARWDSARLAPDPAEHPGAIVQFYSARTWGWKGVVAVHSWVALKPEGAASYDRYDVVGWGVQRGSPALRKNMRPPDGRWAGNEPVLIAELRGTEAAAAIPRIEAAIARYPYRDAYVTWPGPNSNSFVAYLIREVPGLGAELPPTAIGKDFLPNGALFAPTPSGTGLQLSLFGLLGLTVGLDEGLEINLLGLVLGVDPLGLAIKLPGIGRLGLR
ncbi:MAG TPA: DUF3750 domain-containing protein [Geminicoccaceae bacterium]|nr:DUF3750 domain-containing protein [Geminicoccaceae bacterium]